MYFQVNKRILERLNVDTEVKQKESISTSTRPEAASKTHQSPSAADNSSSPDSVQDSNFSMIAMSAEIAAAETKPECDAGSISPTSRSSTEESQREGKDNGTIIWKIQQVCRFFVPEHALITSHPKLPAYKRAALMCRTTHT